MPYLLLLILLCACVLIDGPAAADQTAPTAAQEQPVQLLKLAPPLNERKAEYSGMTWCNGKLILLPQYPKRMSDGEHGVLFAMDKDDILAEITSPSATGLSAEPIVFNDAAIQQHIPIFDGYEAIACYGNTAWLSIEAIDVVGGYLSYLVKGDINWNSQPATLTLSDKVVELPSPSGMVNKGDEAITILGDSVLSLHEINDSRFVKPPVARRVNKAISNLPFPNIPFRITDASQVDSQGRFWVLNYKYSGDDFARNAPDALAEQYGLGASHQRYYNLERLLELRISDQRIELTERAPIQLQMTDVEGRNWEGLVRLNNLGFLLITDKHPDTLFGFVPYSLSE